MHQHCASQTLNSANGFQHFYFNQSNLTTLPGTRLLLISSSGQILDCNRLADSLDQLNISPSIFCRGLSNNRKITQHVSPANQVLDVKYNKSGLRIMNEYSGYLKSINELLIDYRWWWCVIYLLVTFASRDRPGSIGWPEAIPWSLDSLWPPKRSWGSLRQLKSNFSQTGK